MVPNTGSRLLHKDEEEEERSSSSPLTVCLCLPVCSGGDVTHNHDGREVASRVHDVGDTRRRLGGLPGRGEEGLGTKPVRLAAHQTRRDLHPGPGAGKTCNMPVCANTVGRYR